MYLTLDSVVSRTYLRELHMCHVIIPQPHFWKEIYYRWHSLQFTVCLLRTTVAIRNLSITYYFLSSHMYAEGHFLLVSS